MMGRGGDPTGIFRVEVNPIHPEPLLRIGFIRCDEVKLRRIHADGMAEQVHVTRQYEVEQFNLVAARFSLVEVRT
jgi:hypothetical protein